MKIFLTVGTTRFDALVDAFIREPYFQQHQCCAQAGPGWDGSASMEVFRLHANVRRYYQWADLVITHGGAGTIYQLLELGKNILIVPNSERLDSHQDDIACYMEANGYATVERNIKLLGPAARRALAFTPQPYDVDRFFGAREVLSLLS